MTIHPLDQVPASAADAAAQLRQMADISQRAALPNMERRLRALATWVEGLSAADAELAGDVASTRGRSTKTALKRNERTNERTNEQSARQVGRRIGASLT